MSYIIRKIDLFKKQQPTRE